MCFSLAQIGIGFRPWTNAFLLGVFDGSKSTQKTLRVHIISLNFSIKDGLSPSLRTSSSKHERTSISINSLLISKCQCLQEVPNLKLSRQFPSPKPTKKRNNKKQAHTKRLKTSPGTLFSLRSTLLPQQRRSVKRRLKCLDARRVTSYLLNLRSVQIINKY